MVDHELNGEHDCCTLQCLGHGNGKSRWRVEMKDTAAKGILTLYGDEDGFEGWDWDGDKCMLDCGGWPTNAMQDAMDCLADVFQD